jgi:hypothetical protein
MGLIKIVKDKYYQAHNSYINSFGYCKYRKYNSNETQLITENLQFKNSHEKQRCFILGNGPSLKNENLLLLQGECVFTVNQIARHEDFESINPTYHFWADPSFFQDNDTKEDEELISTMKNTNLGENKPICFFPVEQLDFIRKHNIEKDIKVCFFKSGLIFHDSFKKAIDYTKFVPGFGTVVQWCITMAVYMGFREIYLLGCDNTGLMCTFNSALKRNNNEYYGYEITENEQRRMEKLLDVNKLEAYVQSYLNTLKDYRRLYLYCARLGIKLINCSSETVIDSIPRKSLSEVLMKAKVNSHEN